MKRLYDLTKGRDFGVVAQHPWRLADLGSKLAFLKAGLGWGGMPEHVVRDDIARGDLVVLRLRDWPDGVTMPMYAVHRADRPPGPAGRWLIERLTETVEQCQTVEPVAALGR